MVYCRGFIFVSTVNKPSVDIMVKFLTGMKRKEVRNRDNEPNLSRAKTRKYDKAYVALDFTVTKVGDEERPVCLLCPKMLAADSMKPSN